MRGWAIQFAESALHATELFPTSFVNCLLFVAFGVCKHFEKPTQYYNNLILLYGYCHNTDLGHQV